MQAAALSVLYCQQRSRQRQRSLTEVDPEPKEPSFQPTTFITNPPTQQDTSHDWSPASLLPKDADLQNDDMSPSRIPPQSSMSFSTHMSTSLMAAICATRYTLPSKLPQSAEVKAIVDTHIDPSGVTPIGMMSVHVTEEQSQFAQGLPTSRGLDIPTDNIVLPPVPPKPGIRSQATTADHVPRPSVVSTRTSQYSLSNEPHQPAEAETISRGSALSIRPMATDSSVHAYSDIMCLFPLLWAR